MFHVPSTQSENLAVKKIMSKSSNEHEREQSLNSFWFNLE